MNSESSVPPCADWDIWVGPEIEGHDQVGIKTLFIRSMRKFPHVTHRDDMFYLRMKSKCSRVWFCKEFTDWKMVSAIAKHFDEVCIEVVPACLLAIPAKLRAKARIYIKVELPVTLKPGDHVCVGPRFNDEAFRVGSGATVKPEQYLGDTKIV